MPLNQSSKQDALGSSIIAGEGVAGTQAGGVVTVQGDPSGIAQPISATALPLPAGAATSANQTSEITALTSIQSTSNSTAVNTNAVMNNQTNGTQRTLVTDLLGNLQPAGSSPSLTIYVRLNDGTSNIGSTTINSKDRLDVDLSSEGVDNTTAPFGTVQIGGVDPTGKLQTFSTDASGNIYVNERIAVTPASPTFATIGVTSTTAVASNTNRKGLILQNTSSLATVSLNIVGGAAVLNSGITLYPHDVWEMDTSFFTTSQINAISSLASTNLSIQEAS